MECVRYYEIRRFLDCSNHKMHQHAINMYFCGLVLWMKRETFRTVGRSRYVHAFHDTFPRSRLTISAASVGRGHVRTFC